MISIVNCRLINFMLGTGTIYFNGLFETDCSFFFIENALPNIYYQYGYEVLLFSLRIVAFTFSFS